MLCDEGTALAVGVLPTVQYCPPTGEPSMEVLIARASALPVFSAVVRTVYLARASTRHGGQSASLDAGMIEQDNMLVANPTLATSMLWDESVQGATEERRFLAQMCSSGHIRLDGPFPSRDYPSPSDPQEIAEYKLACRLNSPRQIATDAGQCPVQLVHVSAHSAVGQRGNEAYSSVRLSRISQDRRSWLGLKKADFQQSFTVTNGLLNSVWSVESRPLKQGPLAVISSCESAALTWEGTLSIAGSLLRAGYRAVLGTETAVGGHLAYRYFSEFYNELFDFCPAGEAARRARCTLLLKEPTTPLGCLFTLHGNPDLVISK